MTLRYKLRTLLILLAILGAARSATGWEFSSARHDAAAADSTYDHPAGKRVAIGTAAGHRTGWTAAVARRRAAIIPNANVPIPQMVSAAGSGTMGDPSVPIVRLSKPKKSCVDTVS
jgi:hypothetical protein